MRVVDGRGSLHTCLLSGMTVNVLAAENKQIAIVDTDHMTTVHDIYALSKQLITISDVKFVFFLKFNLQMLGLN